MANSHAHAWIDAFNRHDLDAVMSFYSNDVTIRSPLAILAKRSQDGVIRGKQAVREFFALGTSNPSLKFELIEALAGANAMTIIYRNHRGQTVTDCSELDSEGKIVRMVACYSEPTPAATAN